MMKEALKYYNQNSTKVPQKITLGEWNSGNSRNARIKTRTKTKPASRTVVNLAFAQTPEEKALVNLVNSGQLGNFLSHFAAKAKV